MTHITTRFAPSPTGLIHVGGVRTALFAWLVAQQQNGTFLLRIEDTDKEREVSGAEQHIIDSLTWLGLSWNEGPDVGGPNAPYRQSERLLIYTEWAKKLISAGRAYADPYTKEELQAFRDEAKALKKPFLYRTIRPTNPPVWDGTQPLRFKSEPTSYTWTDAVLGELSAGEDAVDDFILVKPDGYPTYNFCHIIDDSIMGVTHVIRSQEFIASVPKFLNLYEALGVEKPIFATLPYVMAIDGNKKLSKRDGAKDILDYQKEGYLAEAMMNFLATLGWNDGTEQELFTQKELIAKFSLNHVQKSPARFDEKRLLWMNGQWIRRIDIDDLFERSRPFWPASSHSYDDTYKREVLLLAKDRIKTLQDLQSVTAFFFAEQPSDITLITSHKQLSKRDPKEMAALLDTAISTLYAIQTFTAESIQEALNSLLIQTNEKPMVLFSIIRIATTWSPFSPDLAPSLALLGLNTTVERLTTARQLLAPTP